jgi:hypothetical protein
MFIKKYFSKGLHHTFNKTVLHKYPLKSSSKISYLEEKQPKYNGGENHAPTRILVKSLHARASPLPHHTSISAQ